MNFFLTSHFDLLLEENTVESLRHNKEGLAIYCTKTAASCLREREERAMAMVQEEKKNVRKPEQLHHVILENRSKMSISGVEEVDSGRWLAHQPFECGKRGDCRGGQYLHLVLQR